jgi:Contractile injection system tape measure protein
MSKQRHIIGRTVLKLDTGQLADVWSLQEDMSRLLQQQGVPAMERLFDQLVGDEEVVRLDQVVVQVGSIDRRFLADEFIHKLLDALSQTLGDRLVAGAKTEKITRDAFGSDWEVLLYFLQYGRLPWWCPSGDWQAWFTRWSAVMQSDTNWREPLRELLTSNQAARQRLIEQLPEPFLHQLILQVQPAWINWHTLLTQARQLIQSLELGRGAIRYLERQAWLLLLGEIGADNAPTRPFPATWTRNWLAQLVQTWGRSAALNRSGSEADSQQQLPSALSNRENFNQIARKRLRATLGAVPSGEQALWLKVLDQVLTPISDTTRSLNREEILTSLAGQSKEREETEDFIPNLQSSTDNESNARSPQNTELTQEKRFDSQETTNQNDRQRLRTIITALPIAESSLWLTALDQVLSATSAEAIAPSANWRETPILQTHSNSTLSTVEETAGLYITQAGLVLLHPFLRFYLEAIGLLDGESFRDESAQQTAIYLLYYLATKQTDAPEYELVLPKLLCGWPLNEPVVRGLDLPEAALEEGEHLLQTAIAYWEALKSTSPDGLREGFLQREGKLTRSGEGNWKLQVEQQAIDILLGSLPWGLSMVTLPWMDELLIVEWN